VRSLLARQASRQEILDAVRACEAQTAPESGAS